MTRIEIRKQVFQLVADVSGYRDDSTIHETDKLIDDNAGRDSLDHVELIMDVEEAFKVEIPDDHAEKLITVADLIDYLLERDSATPRTPNP